jgi:hypothetical protein
VIPLDEAFLTDDAIGLAVYHDKFGQGVVKEIIVNSAGRPSLFLVEFSRCGERRLAPGLARLMDANRATSAIL